MSSGKDRAPLVVVAAAACAACCAAPIAAAVTVLHALVAALAGTEALAA